jgi:hypothetical protein
VILLIHHESHSRGRSRSAENTLAPSASVGDVASMTPRPYLVTSSPSQAGCPSLAPQSWTLISKFFTTPLKPRLHVFPSVICHCMLSLSYHHHLLSIRSGAPQIPCINWFVFYDHITMIGLHVCMTIVACLTTHSPPKD